MLTFLFLALHLHCSFVLVVKAHLQTENLEKQLILLPSLTGLARNPRVMNWVLAADIPSLDNRERSKARRMHNHSSPNTSEYAA